MSKNNILTAKEIFDNFQGYYDLILRKLDKEEKYEFERVFVKKEEDSNAISSLMGLSLRSSYDDIMVFEKLLRMTKQKIPEKLFEIADFYIKHGGETSLLQIYRDWHREAILKGEPVESRCAEREIIGRKLFIYSDVIVEARKKGRPVGYITASLSFYGGKTAIGVWPCVTSEKSKKRPDTFKERGKDLSVYLLLALQKFAKDLGAKTMIIGLKSTEEIENTKGLTKRQKEYYFQRRNYMEYIFRKKFKTGTIELEGKIWFKFDLNKLPEIKPKP